ncbi:hypothetical protein [Bradyrhizobium lablabi]|uniref:hypothetical protein n=1 Tax=Bradyrhizobium lablabi TaxID=722472 RepID=UPI001BAB901A|nr:hypothetical protein [Bradyrhizobium lablabi]MBR0695269.1 hypothetical protein [Bradyrhizobium lablabi]
MSWNHHHEELQREILRSIFRSNSEQSGRSTRLPKGAIWRSEALKETAAQLFAAYNGWQFEPEWLHWHELEAVAPNCWGEQVRGLVYEPLLFVDERGVPVAFASQPLPQDRRYLDGFLGLAADMGLYANAPPAAYASILDPGRRQFLVFSRQRLPVRWLPEQEEASSPFSVHANEAPSFRQFLKEARSPDETCQHALDYLRCVASDKRYRAMPELFVSFCQFITYFGHHHLDAALLADIWSRYVAWSKEQVSLILQYDKEIAEIAS